MKAMEKDLQSVVKSLKALLKKTERIERKLHDVSATRSRKGRSPGAERAKPAGRREETAMIGVYTIIRKSRKGATTTQIREKTGYDNKKIWNAINRLKTQKKIKSASRGVYVSTN